MQVIAYEPETLEREVLKALLSTEGHGVQFCQTAEQVLNQCQESTAHMVLLSNQGDEGCLSLCRKVRAVTPAPLVTIGRSFDDELATALYEAGVDETLTRPISPRLLLARIENLRRRATGPLTSPSEAEEKLAVGGLKYYPALLELHRDERIAHLSPLQGRLLYHLMQNAGQIVPRKRLEEKLWGDAADLYGDTLKTHVCHLRRKLDDLTDEPSLIQTVKGIGYRFQRPQA